MMEDSRVGTHCPRYLPVTLYSLVKSTTPTSNSFPISNYSLGLRPRCQYDARESAGTLHDSRASARPLRGRQRSRAAPSAAANGTRSRPLNSRLVRAACSGYGMPLPSVCPSCEAEEGFDHMQEPFAGCDLHPYAGVPYARIPPVVPAPGSMTAVFRLDEDCWSARRASRSVHPRAR